MQKIYIEVTNLTKARSLTGIQRVVKSVVLELNEICGAKLCFIAYNNSFSRFELLNSDSLIEFAKGNKGALDKMFSGEYIMPDNMKPGDIFFEIDAVWNENYKSSVLLPKLKQNGVRIACYVYDVIPITHPQFTHYSIRFNYMNYIGAYLQYADILITSSQSTLDSIYELSDKLGLKRIPGFVSWHGSDFNISSSNAGSSEVSENVKILADRRFILIVGTIEPRKNHSFLLDAFENGLFEKNISLVFAGKMGWNVEKLKERIVNHPENGKKFFYFEGLNDASIDYLYSKAFAVAQPTYAEGFCLPIIESLQRGTPVLASDIPVLREVGGDYCRYFKLDDIKEFGNVLSDLMENESKYQKLKEHIAGYRASTWKETAVKIADALDTLKIKEKKAKKNVSQMVVLTARVDDIARSVPFIEAYMPFIERILLCCPDSVADEMKSIPTKRIKIDTLTDQEILGTRELPKDHSTRNYFLRCLAMQSDKIDEVFIMSDDDYRPLKNITLDMYIEDNSYIAYYCNRLNEWKGVVGAMTSYDHCHFKSRDFVNKNRYPALQYSSHMPQIIDKEIFLEMICEHEGIELTGIDEWTSYFNYAQAKYPDLIKSKPYVTANWPGLLTDWKIRIKPTEFVFENFYDVMYEEGQIFEGLSKTYNENTDAENIEKQKRCEKAIADYFKQKSVYASFCEKEIKDKLEIPSFVIKFNEGKYFISTPEHLEMAKESVMHLPIKTVGDIDNVSFQLEIRKENSCIQRMTELNLNKKDLSIIDNEFDATLICGPKGTRAGEYQLSLILDDGHDRYEKSVPLKLI